jgi:hypothetical protein
VFRESAHEIRRPGMGRKKTEEDFRPIPTPDRELIHPSGWCMTDYHDGCKRFFNHGICMCECHTKKGK